MAEQRLDTVDSNQNALFGEIAEIADRIAKIHNRVDNIMEDTKKQEATATNGGDAVTELMNKCHAQGEKVREIKATKDKVATKAAVVVLLDLKKQYKELTGQDVPAAPDGKHDVKHGHHHEKRAGTHDHSAKPQAGANVKKDVKKEGKKEDKKKEAAPKKEGKKSEGTPKAKADKKTDDVKEAPAARQEGFSFPKAEEEILAYWKEIQAFETSLKLSEGRKEFTFYDGPPFATGKPHYGHILAGTIKDVVCRYAHQTGHYVERKFGWDTHGLPVEFEIDKTHNISGPADVEKMGIRAYNKLCRDIVMRYSGEWKEVVTRLGRWIDFEDDYKTMYPTFMESVWWVFGQLFEKGLVYRGFKVMPFSTALATPLSNFEANQEFADCKDPWLIVDFPVTDEENTFFLAWTTTPWTLPSNLALCVHPEMKYVKVKDVAKDCFYYCMEARLAGKSGCLYTEKDKAKKAFEIVEHMLGKDIMGKKYTPLFDFFKEDFSETAWRVLGDDYVTADSGVGIVHQAPAFGEDDYRVCMRDGIVTKDGKIPCPIDDQGKFTSDVEPYAGMYIKDADKVIMQDLKARNRVIASGSLTHRDAFCWRSKTRLVRKAVDSWFVKVSSFNADLLKSNENTHWVPNNVKEKRFHNWLENARDWNISRNRYWGTPIPLWVSDDYEEVVCISSIQQLEELSGVTGITDLHRENIDDITIPSKQGKGVLRRIKQVFDCWFESGSMPYASRHYPFEQKERFDNTFPADFIAEGIDQTRGWFYTLTVLGTALFGKSPFKNLIVNGLVLAKDGKKMSKSLKNYPDPTEVINKYGSDSVRCYLINSPVVRGESLKFNEAGVQGNLKDLFLPWLNAIRFFKQCAEAMEARTGSPFVFDDQNVCPSTNVTDRWVLAFAQDTLRFVHQEMKGYRLYTVVPKAFGFVEQLTNWYIRFNRKRLKGDAGADDANMAMWALGEVLFTQSRMMAPFAPFFAEWSYQQLRPHVKSAEKSLTAVEAPSNWSTTAVGKWLKENGLETHVDLFAEEGLAGADLLDLNHEDLESIGIETCHERKALLRESKKLVDVEDECKSQGPAATEYKSVHFLMLPQPNEQYADDEIVRAFDVMKVIINSGRIVRDRATIPVKYPLRELVIISKIPSKLADAKKLQNYIEDELNIQKFTTTSNETDYNIRVQTEPNQRVLGQRLKAAARPMYAEISKMSDAQVAEFQSEGKITLMGHELSGDDILISYVVDSSKGENNYVANVDPSDPQIIVLLDCVPSEEMLMEGTSREVCSNVQKARKTAKLTPKDPVSVYLTVDTDDAKTNLSKVLTTFQTKMSEDLKSPIFLEAYSGSDGLLTTTNTIGKAGAKITITLVKK